MDRERVLQELKEYDGPVLSLMEVCGTHTASIARSGLRSLLSPKIRLISGPGCPVCVTPTAFIDRCIFWAMKDGCALYSFGDMLKVPGSERNLSEAKGDGAKISLMYSPLEVVEKAATDPDTTYVIAAVGFETTAPAYALALKEAEARGIRNLRFVTALKRVIPALEWICENEPGIDGFLCPGHVSVVIGAESYGPMAQKYRRPFTIAGFEPEHILAAVYDLMRQVKKGTHEVRNLYPSSVTEKGNRKAQEALEQFFVPGDAVWRGLGSIADSGLYLPEQMTEGYDGGSFDLTGDKALPEGCRCGDVIVGRISPRECPMFGKACTPIKPCGPCMVSTEGACGIWFRHGS